MTKIERVARAIAKSCGRDEHEWEFFVPEARDVIKAVGKSEDAKRIKYLSGIEPIRFSAILDAAWVQSQSCDSQEESFRRAIDAARKA